MAIYVCGFAMTQHGDRVLLVKKTHPNWQAGKFNGIGGHVENGESAGAGMAREFKEETCGRLVGSALYQPSGWRHFLTLMGDDWQCLFFHGLMSALDMSMMHGRLNDVKEELASIAVAQLSTLPIIPNLAWIVTLANSLSTFNAASVPVVLNERYKGAVIDEAKRAGRSGDRPSPPSFDLIAHLERQRHFSLNTFGPGPRTLMVIRHIRKELAEILVKPTDLEEWIDVIMLGLDGAQRAGHEPQQIAAALSEKLTKNENRDWPDWRTADPDQPIEHVRQSAGVVVNTGGA